MNSNDVSFEITSLFDVFQIDESTALELHKHKPSLIIICAHTRTGDKYGRLQSIQRNETNGYCCVDCLSQTAGLDPILGIPYLET